MDEVFAHIVFADYGGEIVRREPFALEAIVAEGVKGVRVRLPMTGAEAMASQVDMAAALRCVVRALEDMATEIVLPPEGFAAAVAEMVSSMAVARSTDVLPFLLPRAMKKALAAVGKEQMRCEVAVLCGEVDLAECVLEQICHDTNFLTVVVQGKEKPRLRSAAARIYTETGLEAVLTDDVKQALARADVVVHTSPPEATYVEMYRRAAISLDLSGSRGMTAVLLARRVDVLAADGLYASLGRTTFPQEVLVPVLYGKSEAFARLVREEYSADLAAEVRADLARLRVTVSAYAQAGRALSVAGLMRQRMTQ